MICDTKKSNDFLTNLMLIMKYFSKILFKKQTIILIVLQFITST